MPTPIHRAELVRLMHAGGVQVVDVLPRREYDEAHLPGAVNIPLRRLDREAASGLSPAQPVVVYCHDGL